MSRIDDYREVLKQTNVWEEFLLQESGLPGPRGNIELAQAAALEGDEVLFNEWLSYSAASAPTNTPQEFLAFCGVLGMGELLAAGRLDLIDTLRNFANDTRWRMREAVAMALQKLGRQDMDRLVSEMKRWSRGSLLEKRAAAAALCEPDILVEQHQIEQVLKILDEITASIPDRQARRQEDFRTLRKGLGYCWSVAVAAYPEKGKALMESWMESKDADIRWIMKENLKKKRLARVDESWVSACISRYYE